MGADAGVQFGEPDRLGQIIVGTGFEADDDVHLVGACGEHDDHRCRQQRAQASTDLDAVEIGQTEIQQDQVDGTGNDDSATSGALPPHIVAMRAQTRV